jgi:CRISPR-associated protein (TIGR03984 family)
MGNDRILYGRVANDITSIDALKNCAECFKDAVGLLYSPESCQFVKVRGDLLTNETGDPVGSIGVFEARIFNRQYELRWLNRSHGTGRAVLLSQNTIEQYLTEDIPKIEAIDIIDSQYLLWGEGIGKKEIDPNWSYLSAARIGKLAVPVAGIKRNDRVKLRFREYLGVCDEHGNVAVVEERLIDLSKY